MKEFHTISFRVKKEDLKEFQFIADVLYQGRRLKKPSLGLMAKNFLYVMSNQFIEIQHSALSRGITQNLIG